MLPSENILIIKSLSIEPEETAHYTMRFKSKMEACIKFLCPVTGNHFRTLVIIAENKGYSQDEALRNVIQDFMNEDCYIDRKIYNRPFECFVHTKINHVDIQVQEPFRSLFEQLFDVSKWEIPKREIAAHAG